MRPDHLNPLFATLGTLKGVGPKTVPAYDRLLSKAPGETARVSDLLFHLPTHIVDRRLEISVIDAVAGELATMTLTVKGHRPSSPARSNRPYRVDCEDKTGDLTLVYFSARQDYLEKILPVGETVIVSGRIDFFGGEPQMVHPDYVVLEKEREKLPLIEPIYRLTAGLSKLMLGRSMTQCLEKLPSLPEWIEPSLLSERHWPTWSDALLTIHKPSEPEDAEPEGRPWQRLAFDELFAGQLALALLRARMRERGGVSRKGPDVLAKKVKGGLPYSLTGAQERAVGDILNDLEKPERMLRLLQGDVGSGKTVVAALALTAAVSAGWQTAMMVPTEILARQHLKTLQDLLGPTGIRVALLTGRDSAAERRGTLSRLQEGEIDVLVGTHALFQDRVTFKRLGFAVIDEQHRFGVHQRLALNAKGGDDDEDHVDLLIMTATPIPRTLVLTHYGDMEVSQLDEKPPGRQPVDTRILPKEKADAVTERLLSHASAGGQAYWVCPLVEDGELENVTAATDRYNALAHTFADRVGLIHGKMAGPDKDAVMASFIRGEIAVLVATTVIEVGVDVPNATIMVIENAERLGLAQLHQLRGRVGRGSGKSTCLLLYAAPLSQNAENRLRIMRETEDGFLIAEEDLALRGGGEILGTKQSGVMATQIADPAIHGELLGPARQSARLLVETDPSLLTSRGRACRELLHLQGKIEAVRLIEAG